MGHVDHGKTSLLDAIRQTNVAGREAGGITQHIGAYHVEKNGRKIVFIDTPGHQAFTRMRARGAKVTDIVVLVVAADDGVMPQTLEAIDHARAAKVPIIVAINKIDKPDAQPERIKQQLVRSRPAGRRLGRRCGHGSGFGQSRTESRSAARNDSAGRRHAGSEGQPGASGHGHGARSEARSRPRSGGDRAGAQRHAARRRLLHLRLGVRQSPRHVRRSRQSGQGSRAVDAGRSDRSREPARSRRHASRWSPIRQGQADRHLSRGQSARSRHGQERPRATLDSLHEQFKEGELKELNIILKTDVGGTAEVLSDTLQKLSNDKVRVRVLHAGVGAITETDVLLASASNAIIIGFNVRPERNAQATAEQQKVDIRLHTIIYELIDEIKHAMTGLLDPVFKETIQGRAEVREVFRISKVGTVAGCYVADGAIRRDSQVRLLRDGDVIHTGKIEALKRFKNDASEVKNGLECGISLANFNNIKVGDVIEAFAMERVAPRIAHRRLSPVCRSARHRRPTLEIARGRLALSERQSGMSSKA